MPLGFITGDAGYRSGQEGAEQEVLLWGGSHGYVWGLMGGSRVPYPSDFSLPSTLFPSRSWELCLPGAL